MFEFIAKYLLKDNKKRNRDVRSNYPSRFLETVLLVSGRQVGKTEVAKKLGLTGEYLIVVGKEIEKMHLFNDLDDSVVVRIDELNEEIIHDFKGVILHEPVSQEQWDKIQMSFDNSGIPIVALTSPSRLPINKNKEYSTAI